MRGVRDRLYRPIWLLGWAVAGVRIQVDPSVMISQGDRHAITLALAGGDPGLVPDELRIVRQLDEGMSSARVFEAELEHASGTVMQVVIKVDRADRLMSELEAAARLSEARAPNIAPPVAPTLESAREVRPGRAAIVYRHGREPWSGPSRSLRSLARDAIATPEDRERLLTMVGRTLAALEAQVHGPPSEKGSGERRDFYLRRWLPSVTVAVDEACAASGELRERLPYGVEESARQLNLGEENRVDELPAKGSVGERVKIRLPLKSVGDRVVGGIRGYGTVGFEMPDAVAEEVRAWSPRQLLDVAVHGTLTATGPGTYAAILRDAGLDPEAPSWEVGRHTFVNSLRAHRRNLFAWDSRGRGHFVFGHGDLHDCNVLIIGDEFTLIDLGLAGEGHPRWADAARLFGSLLVNALAPTLSVAEIAGALHRAFIGADDLDLRSEDRITACSAILRGIAERAAKTSRHPAEDARREFWIDTHHFCWIAIKWAHAGPEEERARRVTAMALLASIASTCVAQEQKALARLREERPIEQLRGLSELVEARAVRTGDIEAVLQLQLAVREMMAGLTAAVFVDDEHRSKLLDRHVEAALREPSWGAAWVGQLEELRRSVPLTVVEQVMLIDTLLFGCARRWCERAFRELLTLSESGEPDVALEAYVAVFLLLDRPSARRTLGADGELSRHVARVLSRPEAREVLHRLNQVASGGIRYDLGLVRGTLLREHTPSALWGLRPFRASSAPQGVHPQLIDGLEASVSFSDFEKHAIARSYDALQPWQVTQLVDILDGEARRFHQLRASALWKRVQVRFGSILQFAEQVAEDDLAVFGARSSFPRTLADFIDEEREFAALAVEMASARLVNSGGLKALAALCAEGPDAGDPAHAHMERAWATGGLENFAIVLEHAEPAGARHLRDDLRLLAAIDRADLSRRSSVISRVVCEQTFALLLTSISAVDGLHAETLGNFALFMKNVRGEMDEAESLYRRALAADPSHANNLGSFALFMKNVRGEMDKAESLYRRALAADPAHANNLGNFALFMWTVRGEMDEAESLYRKALAADPTHANNLGNFAFFMADVRGEMDEAESLYRRALAADPTHANNLGRFALFMWTVRGEMDEAESLYRRALAADPAHADHLGNFAYFMWTVRGEMDEAESLYRRALAADPAHANNLGNFAGFLFCQGTHDEAKDLSTRARAIPTLKEPTLLELHFYDFVHLPEARATAAHALETMLARGVRSPAFDLSRHVARARSCDHPEFARVARFAAQISGTTAL